MRAGAEAEGLVCHNQYSECGRLDECPCRACKRRRKRARSKSASTTTKKTKTAALSHDVAAAASASAQAGSHLVEGGSPVAESIASTRTCVSAATTVTDNSYSTNKRVRTEAMRVRVFSRSIESAATGIVVALRSQDASRRAAAGDSSDDEADASTDAAELRWRSFLSDVRDALRIDAKVALRVVDERGCEYRSLDALRDGDCVWIEHSVSRSVVTQAAAAESSIVLPVAVARGGAGGWHTAATSYDLVSQDASEDLLVSRAADMLGVMMANAANTAHMAGSVWGVTETKTDSERTRSFGSSLEAYEFLDSAAASDEFDDAIAAAASLSDETLERLAHDVLQFDVTTEDEVSDSARSEGTLSATGREARDHRGDDERGASARGRLSESARSPHVDGKGEGKETSFGRSVPCDDRGHPREPPDPRPRPPPFPSWAPCVFAALACRRLRASGAAAVGAVAVGAVYRRAATTTEVEATLIRIFQVASARALRVVSSMLLETRGKACEVAGPAGWMQAALAFDESASPVSAVA